MDLKTIALVCIFVAGSNATKFEDVQHPAIVRILKNSQPQIDPKADIQQPFSKYLPRCGEIHRPNEGGIFYKPFEQVMDMERCVWIIGSPGAVGYTVDIQFLGDPTNQPESGQALVLTGVQFNNQSEPILTSYQPTAAGVITISDSNIVVVTFFSPALNNAASSGFVLEYTGIQEGNITKTSPASVHSIIELSTFNVKYPVAANYTNLELAALVFIPKENFYTNVNNIFYTTRLGSNCTDSLNFYTLRTEVNAETDVWQHQYRICDDVDTEMITSEDIMLILFQSDDAEVNSGVWYWFNSC